MKHFINRVAKSFPNLTVKYIPGLDPRIIFKDSQGKEMTRQDISRMDATEISNLLQSKGMKASEVES